MILSVLTEAVMPSGTFGKYVKTALGLVILVTLAYPALKFSDFDALYEKYAFYGGTPDAEETAVFDTEKIIKDEFERKICAVIQDDIKEKFSENCGISADYDGGKCTKIYISCGDGNFDKISGYISQKYGLQCAKNEKTGY
ncbi:stage III sporulation protein AF [Qingrenia yutianensis]|uniref:Stage III sporulation protein AF n=1 Tax=Qingrenia yutianensis TaxID=2763676 RepID=A0A926FC92_9FIRM|nr:stage III sporulation protein AF [Qingrenia yutianensis]MBC8596047.1 stage III sporulation protein AF [Qingrenia yutianensis]